MTSVLNVIVVIRKQKVPMQILMEEIIMLNVFLKNQQANVNNAINKYIKVNHMHKIHKQKIYIMINVLYQSTKEYKIPFHNVNNVK